MKTTFRISRRSSVVTVFAIVTLLSLTVYIKTAQAATQFRLVRTLISPTPTGGSFFGKTLGVAGDRFLVGSDDCVIACGAVHVFDSDGNFIRTIFPPTTETSSLFGDSVGAMGSNVLVGAPLDNTGGESAGAAYLFDGATGGLLQTFLNPNPDHPPFPPIASVLLWQVLGTTFSSRLHLRTLRPRMLVPFIFSTAPASFSGLF